MFKRFFLSAGLIAILFISFASFLTAPFALAGVPPPSTSLQSPDFTFKLGGTGGSTGIINPNIPTEKWARGGVNYFFERGIAIMATSVGVVTVLMMSFGGFLMILSHGDQDQFNKGKGYIIKAALGLALVLGAYLIVTTVQLVIRSIYG